MERHRIALISTGGTVEKKYVALVVGSAPVTFAVMSSTSTLTFGTGYPVVGAGVLTSSK